ncbi:hypothetical protein [Limnoglobus roseus]|uniref:Uncharacterized protein n=1 Tax=Limnoglobus roseus TaxID=2598579 RepID=A0A5C1AA21_9BACT|nr:hypothetical protein [Limnoglobus roseus]QEL15067.1 hypothetical protein PX52LOC_01975 [Limnoglobus roseus]
MAIVSLGISEHQHEGQAMTTCKPAPSTNTRVSPAVPSLASRYAEGPAKPDKQQWKTDKTRAFEASVRWFLSVSRAA